MSGEAAGERSAILFLCVANSARSQIAEALARRLAPAGVEVFSAGSSPQRVHPYAVRVLHEIGIDASQQFSKPIASVPRERVRTVVTLCSDEICPVFPGEVVRLHWPFDDPVGARLDGEDPLEAFRRVRDSIGERLATYFSKKA